MRRRNDFTKNVLKPINTNVNGASNGQDISITRPTESKWFFKIEQRSM